jgi:hypothetical protein
MKKSASAKFYARNPKARAKKKVYDTKYHSTEERKRYRRELARKRRLKKIMGKGGKDVSHTKGGGTKLEAKSKNRARNGSNGKSTKAPRTRK